MAERCPWRRAATECLSQQGGGGVLGGLAHSPAVASPSCAVGSRAYAAGCAARAYGAWRPGWEPLALVWQVLLGVVRGGGGAVAGGVGPWRRRTVWGWPLAAGTGAGSRGVPQGGRLPLVAVWSATGGPVVLVQAWPSRRDPV